VERLGKEKNLDGTVTTKEMELHAHIMLDFMNGSTRAFTGGKSFSGRFQRCDQRCIHSTHPDPTVPQYKGSVVRSEIRAAGNDATFLTCHWWIEGRSGEAVLWWDDIGNECAAQVRVSGDGEGLYDMGTFGKLCRCGWRSSRYCFKIFSSRFSRILCTMSLDRIEPRCLLRRRWSNRS
jgi:hypothetical protein